MTFFLQQESSFRNFSISCLDVTLFKVVGSDFNKGTGYATVEKNTSEHIKISFSEYSLNIYIYIKFLLYADSTPEYT